MGRITGFGSRDFVFYLQFTQQVYILTNNLLIITALVSAALYFFSCCSA
jgi:hypothetical protein